MAKEIQHKIAEAFRMDIPMILRLLFHDVIDDIDA